MKRLRRIWVEVNAWDMHLADALIWAAKRISPDAKHELWRADETYSTCVAIAKGEYKTLREAQTAAYAAVY